MQDGKVTLPYSRFLGYDKGEVDGVLTELQSEIIVVTELIQKCVEENARIALDQTEYQQRYDDLAERYNSARERLDEVSDKMSRGEVMEAFVTELAKQDGLVVEFDERLWNNLVDIATVSGSEVVEFTFKNGVVKKA